MPRPRRKAAAASRAKQDPKAAATASETSNNENEEVEAQVEDKSARPRRSTRRTTRRTAARSASPSPTQQKLEELASKTAAIKKTAATKGKKKAPAARNTRKARKSTRLRGNDAEEEDDDETEKVPPEENLTSGKSDEDDKSLEQQTAESQEEESEVGETDEVGDNDDDEDDDEKSDKEESDDEEDKEKEENDDKKEEEDEPPVKTTAKPKTRKAKGGGAIKNPVTTRRRTTRARAKALGGSEHSKSNGEENDQQEEDADPDSSEEKSDADSSPTEKQEKTDKGSGSAKEEGKDETNKEEVSLDEGNEDGKKGVAKGATSSSSDSSDKGSDKAGNKELSEGASVENDTKPEPEKEPEKLQKETGTSASTDAAGPKKVSTDDKPDEKELEKDETTDNKDDPETKPQDASEDSDDQEEEEIVQANTKSPLEKKEDVPADADKEESTGVEPKSTARRGAGKAKGAKKASTAGRANTKSAAKKDKEKDDSQPDTSPETNPKRRSRRSKRDRQTPTEMAAAASAGGKGETAQDKKVKESNKSEEETSQDAMNLRRSKRRRRSSNGSNFTESSSAPPSPPKTPPPSVKEAPVNEASGTNGSDDFAAVMMLTLASAPVSSNSPKNAVNVSAVSSLPGSDAEKAILSLPTSQDASNDNSSSKNDTLKQLSSPRQPTPTFEDQAEVAAILTSLPDSCTSKRPVVLLESTAVPMPPLEKTERNSSNKELLGAVTEPKPSVPDSEETLIHEQKGECLSTTTVDVDVVEKGESDAKSSCEPETDRMAKKEKSAAVAVEEKEKAPIKAETKTDERDSKALSAGSGKGQETALIPAPKHSPLPTEPDSSASKELVPLKGPGLVDESTSPSITTATIITKAKDLETPGKMATVSTSTKDVTLDQVADAVGETEESLEKLVSKTKVMDTTSSLKVAKEKDTKPKSEDVLKAAESTESSSKTKKVREELANATTETKESTTESLVLRNATIPTEHANDSTKESKIVKSENANSYKKETSEADTVDSAIVKNATKPAAEESPAIDDKVIPENAAAHPATAATKLVTRNAAHNEVKVVDWSRTEVTRAGTSMEKVPPPATATVPAQELGSNEKVDEENIDQSKKGLNKTTEDRATKEVERPEGTTIVVGPQRVSAPAETSDTVPSKSSDKSPNTDSAESMVASHGVSGDPGDRTKLSSTTAEARNDTQLMVVSHGVSDNTGDRTKLSSASAEARNDTQLEKEGPAKTEALAEIKETETAKNSVPQTLAASEDQSAPQGPNNDESIQEAKTIVQPRDKEEKAAAAASAPDSILKVEPGPLKVKEAIAAIEIDDPVSRDEPKVQSGGGLQTGSPAVQPVPQATDTKLSSPVPPSSTEDKTSVPAASETTDSITLKKSMPKENLDEESKEEPTTKPANSSSAESSAESDSQELKRTNEKQPEQSTAVALSTIHKDSHSPSHSNDKVLKQSNEKEGKVKADGALTEAQMPTPTSTAKSSSVTAQEDQKVHAQVEKFDKPQNKEDEEKSATPAPRPLPKETIGRTEVHLTPQTVSLPLTEKRVQESGTVPVYKSAATVKADATAGKPKTEAPLDASTSAKVSAIASEKQQSLTRKQHASVVVVPDGQKIVEDEGVVEKPAMAEGGKDVSGTKGLSASESKEAPVATTGNDDADALVDDLAVLIENKTPTSQASLVDAPSSLPHGEAAVNKTDSHTKFDANKRKREDNEDDTTAKRIKENGENDVKETADTTVERIIEDAEEAIESEEEVEVEVENRENSGKRSRSEFEQKKLLLYTEGEAVHGSPEYDRKFSRYWAAMRMRFDGENNLDNIEKSRALINTFLKTKKLRKLHNKLIKGLLAMCSRERVPLDEISTHIPPTWRKRIKVTRHIPRTRKVLAKPPKYQKKSSTPVGRLGYLPTVGGVSAKPQKVKQQNPNSLRIPGALSIEPQLRALAQGSDMNVGEGTAWLIVASAKEYVSTVLKGCMALKKAVHNDKLKRAQRPRPHPNLGRPEKKPKKEAPSPDIPAAERIISTMDIHNFVSTLPMKGVYSLGGTVSRATYERLQMASGGTSAPPHGKAFQQLKSFIWEKIAPLPSSVVTFQIESSSGNLPPSPSPAKAGGGDGRKTNSVGGLGRGAKDLAALKMRASTKQDGDPMTDTSERGSESSRLGGSQRSMQSARSVASPAASAEVPSEPKQSPQQQQQQQQQRRGKGYSIKDLAAMRAKGVTEGDKK